MNRVILAVAAPGLLIAAWPGRAAGQLTSLGQFNPGLGVLVGAGFDRSTDRVWVYPSQGVSLRGYSRTGASVATLPRPGELADDFDVSFAPVSFTLGTATVPAGSLLAINGETGAADIYAVNPNTGVVIASLTTAFGASHVVGGTYHPGRGTFFLVQDRQPGGGQGNLIAEINPVSGGVRNTFGTGSSDYTVNFGDLEVLPGADNLVLVSSDEAAVRELTPTGTFVRDLALPAGVTSPSGIGFDDVRGEAWVTTTGGIVYRVGGFAPVPEPSLVLPVAGVVAGVLAARRRLRPAPTPNPAGR